METEQEEVDEYVEDISRVTRGLILKLGSNDNKKWLLRDKFSELHKELPILKILVCELSMYDIDIEKFTK